MSEFKDRQAPNLNRKKYIIEDDTIERNECGEIVSFVAEEIRYDTPYLNNEGTPLNAETLTKIINDMIDIKINDTIDLVLSNKDKLNFDLNKIYLPSETIKNFELPLKGYLNTIYSWSILSGNAIEINGNLAIIKRSANTQVVELELNAQNGDQKLNKTYLVNIPGNNVEVVERTFYALPNGSSSAKLVESFSINSNSTIHIENDYPNNILVDYNIKDNTLNMSIIVAGYINDGAIKEVTVSIRVDDATTGITSKIINIKIEIIDSVEGED